MNPKPDKQPTFDQNGYPTEETLKTISYWPTEYPDELLQYVIDAWNQKFGKVTILKNKVKLATGGWSGNESLLMMLKNNREFWNLCWESSHRGGLTVFRRWKTQPKKP